MKNKIGVFLKPGGNKVFFTNGVLKVFKEEGICIDHLVGYSSSSAILFAHVFSCHDRVLNMFGRKLKENKKNFYFSQKDLFPHNDIYKSAVQDMFDAHGSCYDSDISFSVIATRSREKFKIAKGFVSTVSIGINEIGVPVFSVFRKVCGASEFCHDSRSSEKFSSEELIDLVMGSSMIYPFIKLHFLKNDLILDGALASAQPQKYLKGFEKKIIIYTKKGKTCVEGGVLHIYASQKIPNNILDYTSDEKIKILQKYGEMDARKNIDLIKKYVED